MSIMLIKKFKMFILALILTIFLFSCSESSTEPEPDNRQEFEINVYDYSENHYLLDTIYASRIPDFNIFNRYHSSYIYYTTAAAQYFEVVDVEVWRSSKTASDPERELKANAFIDLPARMVGENYADQLRDTSLSSKPGIYVINRNFIKLAESLDFVFNPITGHIALNGGVEEYDVIAAAYRIKGPAHAPEDDLVFGEFASNIKSSEQTLLLKLIKPENLVPEFEHAWKLQLRNIYSIGSVNISNEDFEMQIYRQSNPNELSNSFNGIKYLEMFELDKTDVSGTNPYPDGLFDFNEKAIWSRYGEIIFPYLEPFGKDLPSQLPEDFAHHDIYSNQKELNTPFPDSNCFIFRGKFNKY